jgi:hypothetical protein
VLTRFFSPASLLVLVASVSAQTMPEAPITPIHKIELKRVGFENAALLSAEEQKHLSREIHEESPEDQVFRIGSVLAEDAAAWVRELIRTRVILVSRGPLSLSSSPRRLLTDRLTSRSTCGRRGHNTDCEVLSGKA